MSRVSDFSIDTRGVANTKGMVVAMVGMVVAAGIGGAVTIDEATDIDTETTEVLKSQIEIVSQDKVRVTPLIGNPLPAKHLRVKVTFPNQNKSGVEVTNIRGASEKTVVAQKRVTENVTVGVEHVPVYRNISVPGVGRQRKLQRMEERPVTRNVTRVKTSYRFDVEEWHNQSGASENGVERIGNESSGFFSPIEGLAGGKKETLASRTVSGVGGSFMNQNSRLWSSGESFVIDLRQDIINEGDVVAVSVYDTRSGNEVIDKAVRANELPYTGFELNENNSENLKTKPNAEIFGPDTAAPGEELAFSIEANDLGGDIDSIEWSNGQTGPTAAYVFNERPGTEVTLSATVIDTNGNTTTTEHTVRMIEPPNTGPDVSIQGPTTVEFGAVQNYVVNATDQDGTVTDIEWSNGDSGSTASVSFFKSPGKTRTLIVSATDDDGATTNTSKTVRIIPVTEDNTSDGSGTDGIDTGVTYSDVNQAPEVSLDGPASMEKGESGTYSVSASDPDGTVESISWSNGDRGTSASVPITGVVGEQQRISVDVTDNDGATTTRSVTVRVLEPELSATIHGPSKIVSGDQGSFTVSATENIESAQWTMNSPNTFRETARRRETTFNFDDDPGSTAAITLTVTDTDGDSTTVSKTVEVVAGASNPPDIKNVELEPGTPSGCLPPDEPTPITVNAEDMDPAGEITETRWYDEFHTAPVGTGDRLLYTPSGSPGSQTDIAVTVWDNNGQSDSEVTTREICGQRADQSPTLVKMVAKNPDGTRNDTNDYFQTEAGFRTKLFQFKAYAEDDSQGDLTYVWKFPDGHTKKTVGSGSSVLYGFGDSISEGDTRSVTLLVRDDSGKTKRETKTITWGEHTTLRYSNRLPPLSVSSQSVGTDEPVEVSYSGTEVGTGQAFDPPSGSYSLRLTWGDGTSSTIQNQDKETPFSLSHQYQEAGEYTIQAYPLDRHGNIESGSEVWSRTVTVDGGSYDVYSYTADVRTATKVASSRPGPLWEQMEFDHAESELISEQNKDIPASDAVRIQQLKFQGWTEQGSHYEDVHTGFTTTTDWQSPGSEWSKITQDVGTISVEDGYDYTVTDTPMDDTGGHIGGAEWQFVREVSDTETVKETTHSTSSPGSDWTKSHQVGTVVTGTYTQWHDNRLSRIGGPEYIRSNTYQTEPRTETTDYKCENYVTGDTRWTSSGCGPYENLIQTDTDVDPAEYETDYLYEHHYYDEEYEWYRYTQQPDTDYRYKRQDYRQETLHEWERKTYTSKRFIDLRNAEYNTTLYYVYEKSGTTTQYSLTEPDDIQATRQTYDCGNTGAPLHDEAC